MRSMSKERGTRVKDRAKNGASERAALVSFLARSKPKIPLLGLLRSETKRKRLLRRLIKIRSLLDCSHFRTSSKSFI